MFSELYKNTILDKPKFTFILLVAILIFFGYFSKEFKLDASSDTLLIEGDPDLEYLREVTERYGAKDFLVLTYTPKEPLTDNSSINNLLSLKFKLQSLSWVHSVITVLDVPLLDNSDKPLKDRLNNFVTLKDDDVDKVRGFNEILNSPVFRNFVISEDGKTSGIIVYLKKNTPLENIENKSKKEIENYRDQIKKNNHNNILEIREFLYNIRGKQQLLCPLTTLP